MQRGEIAVPDERRPRPSQSIDVEERQDLDAAVAAAHGDDRIGVHLVERAHEGAGTSRWIAGRHRATVEHRVVVHRVQPEAAQLRDPGVELGTGEGAGGRDERHPAAGPDRAKLDEARGRPRSQRHAAISSATA